MKHAVAKSPISRTRQRRGPTKSGLWHGWEGSSYRSSWAHVTLYCRSRSVWYVPTAKPISSNFPSPLVSYAAPRSSTLNNHGSKRHLRTRRRKCGCVSPATLALHLHDQITFSFTRSPSLERTASRIAQVVRVSISLSRRFPLLQRVAASPPCPFPDRFPTKNWLSPSLSSRGWSLTHIMLLLYLVCHRNIPTTARQTTHVLRHPRN